MTAAAAPIQPLLLLLLVLLQPLTLLHSNDGARRSPGRSQ